MKDKQKLPPGWDEGRIREVFDLPTTHRRRTSEPPRSRQREGGGG